MKGLNRGLEILLAEVLILGGGTVFAVSPNANPNAMKMNPARMKVMEKFGNVMEEMTGIVDDVEVDVIPMENGKIGLIEGRVTLEDDNYEDFKGNTKLKVKLNNVTVNIDSEGNFMQPMPMWKIEPLSVRVFMGKVLVYSEVEDEIDEIMDHMDLERALDRAERIFDRLEVSLEDLDIEDIGLVKSARSYYDLLEDKVGSDEDYDRLLDGYFDILEDAEDEIQELLEEMIRWEDDLDYEDDEYEGELWIHEDLMDEIDEILVIVDFEDPDVDDLEIEVEEDGEVKFEAEDDEFQVRVEYDGVEIIELRVDFD